MKTGKSHLSATKKLALTAAQKASRTQDARRRAIFNITSEEYEKILEYQNGVCFISQKVPKTSLHVDHCHKTGRVRGLLDPWINKGLSFFRDDPVMLRRAAEYLENPPVTAALGEDVYGVVGRVSRKASRRRYGPDGAKTPQQRNHKPL